MSDDHKIVKVGVGVLLVREGDGYILLGRRYMRVSPVKFRSLKLHPSFYFQKKSHRLFFQFNSIQSNSIHTQKRQARGRRIRPTRWTSRVRGNPGGVCCKRGFGRDGNSGGAWINFSSTCSHFTVSSRPVLRHRLHEGDSTGNHHC